MLAATRGSRSIWSARHRCCKRSSPRESGRRAVARCTSVARCSRFPHGETNRGGAGGVTPREWYCLCENRSADRREAPQQAEGGGGGRRCWGGRRRQEGCSGRRGGWRALPAPQEQEGGEGGAQVAVDSLHAARRVRAGSGRRREPQIRQRQSARAVSR